MVETPNLVLEILSKVIYMSILTLKYENWGYLSFNYRRPRVRKLCNKLYASMAQGWKWTLPM